MVDVRLARTEVELFLGVPALGMAAPKSSKTDDVYSGQGKQCLSEQRTCANDTLSRRVNRLYAKFCPDA